MAVKMYLLVFAFLFLVFGLYQFLSGKQTVLSKKILQKYNLPNHFIKKHGILCVLIGCVIFGIVFFYNMWGSIYVLYAGIIILEAACCIETVLVIKNQKNIEGIGRREIWRAGLLLLLTTAFVVYFRPLPLADLFKHAETIQVSVQELGADGGTTYIESAHTVLSEGEKEDIITAAKQYSYYRNLSSLFKYNGTKNTFSDKVLLLYVGEKSQTKTICITSMQEIIIDNHSYTMPGSWRFINNL